MTPLLRKRFDQNRLQNNSVIRRNPATVQPVSGEHLLEIGSGCGTLTAGLLLTAAGGLDLVELDPPLIEPSARACGRLTGLIIHSIDSTGYSAVNRRHRGR